jgi:hypothetical protein
MNLSWMEDDNENDKENMNYHELVMNVGRKRELERQHKLSWIGHEWKTKTLKTT